MAILCCNAWRKAYFDGFGFPETPGVPTDDADAYQLNPRHHWLFNKLQVAELQGLRAGPFGVPPTVEPLFAKPIYNLSGMSVGARRFDTIAEFESTLRPGMMWCEVLEGPHHSIDVIAVDGKIYWLCSTKGYPLDKGTWDFWHIGVSIEPKIEARLRDFVARNLGDYTGALNFEMIGPAIIEVHPRIAVQWIDLYGAPFVRALHKLHETGLWPDSLEQREGYSVVAFAPPAFYPPPPAEIWSRWRATKDVTYLQLPSYAADGTFKTLGMPEGGMRLIVINSTQLAPALALRAEVVAYYLGNHDTKGFRKTHGKDTLREKATVAILPD
ncbi:hypothetical protein [Roseovarius aestuariivivens]|uniref:hypothetical protein n=1 Tax=Roseovarius aestuariivivens TaxID=1888910 RepID=UPI00108036E8|nr:hypothetical protein [Roseovarius aestuariivivens]